VRATHHREPVGLRAIARHYLGDLVYGANDGLITTFAVVAGVSGGQLSARALLIVGAANLFADGLSMGVGNYLSIRSHEGALAAENLPEEESSPARHGLATWLAFIGAGAVPLIPFSMAMAATPALWLSIVLTFATLFTIGAARAVLTPDRWWKAGLEMFGLGVIVALAAYGSGAAIAAVLDNP